MNIPEETPESALTTQQRITRDTMLAFMDDLTALCRQYGIYVTSGGNIDVPTLRVINGDPHKFHYVPFWRDQFEYPMDIIFEEQVPNHLIDI